MGTQRIRDQPLHILLPKAMGLALNSPRLIHTTTTLNDQSYMDILQIFHRAI